MEPLDAEARRLVLAAASALLVTAISPRAAVDMLFVLINALALIRKLAVLYGGRPGTIGVLRLFRQVISHLAMTGGVAVTDSLLQQIIGHGVAARLSARLGEGMLNGILTARLGILADRHDPAPAVRRAAAAGPERSGGYPDPSGWQGSRGFTAFRAWQAGKVGRIPPVFLRPHPARRYMHAISHADLGLSGRPVAALIEGGDSRARGGPTGE